VGKEELVGVLAALEWSLAQDEPTLLAGYEAAVRTWCDGLVGIPGVAVARRYPSEAGQPFGQAVVRLAPPSLWTRDALIAALWDGAPRIAVGTVRDEPDAIALNPQTLEPGEDALVLAALRRQLLSAAR
jgi:L-seryl-tRNA(Ser) seleniumtransferase